MGNRAVITDKNGKVGLYLHWNGGRDSVEAFLKYCELKGYRGLGKDTEYGLARLAQVVGNFFGGSTSVGITTYCKGCDDNGVYVVDGWEIVDRFYQKYDEKTGKYRKAKFPKSCEQHEYSLQEMLEEIDEKQPVSERLGELLLATLVPTENLIIGDVVFIRNWNGEYTKCEVIGFGKDTYVNGTNVLGLPLVNLHKDGDRSNINNYINYKDSYNPVKEVYRA